VAGTCKVALEKLLFRPVTAAVISVLSKADVSDREIASERQARGDHRGGPRAETHSRQPGWTQAAGHSRMIWAAGRAENKQIAAARNRRYARYVWLPLRRSAHFP